MTEILAVFRSRAQAIDALAKLKSAGVAANLVNTPREANVGCGLSVRFFETSFPRVRQILSRFGYTAFGGFLIVYNSGEKKGYRYYLSS